MKTTITLDEKVAAKLRALAEGTGRTVPQTAAALVETSLSRLEALEKYAPKAKAKRKAK